MNQFGRVLCIDDDAQILSVLSRVIGARFEVAVARDGASALLMLENDGPFSVVLSDLYMPGIDGGTLLGQVKQMWPDSVRVLLTGASTLSAAADAMNRGNAFRMLCKPFSATEINAVIDASQAQYQVAMAERGLLEQTLNGTVRMLGEVLGLAAPHAFERARFIRGCMVHMCAELGVQEAWPLVAAGTLAHLGRVALPPDLLRKAHAQQPLDPEEKALLDSSPEAGYQLLARVPRLEVVAEIVRRQTHDIDPAPTGDVALGVAMLRVALFFDDRVRRGESMTLAAAALAKHAFEPRLVDAMASYVDFVDDSVVRDVRVKDIAVDMTLEQDVKAKSGALVVGKGKVVDNTVLTYLTRFSEGAGIVEPIKVRLSAAMARRIALKDSGR